MDETDIVKAFQFVAESMREVPQDVQERCAKLAQMIYDVDIAEQLSVEEFAVVIGLLVQGLTKAIDRAKHKQVQ